MQSALSTSEIKVTFTILVKRKRGGVCQKELVLKFPEGVSEKSERKLRKEFRRVVQNISAELRRMVKRYDAIEKEEKAKSETKLLYQHIGLPSYDSFRKNSPLNEFMDSVSSQLDEFCDKNPSIFIDSIGVKLRPMKADDARVLRQQNPISSRMEGMKEFVLNLF